MTIVKRSLAVLLAALPLAAGMAGAELSPELGRVLQEYKAGMEALSLEQLDELMDPELLVLEHGGKDVGWLAYRNHHLGEHMRDWKSFRVSDVRILESAVSGDLAYVAQESVNTIVAKKDGKTTVLAVTETFVLKRAQGGWRIKHLHVSLKTKS